MEQGVIAKWHKKEGDKIESGDLILEITTDKATVEHNALDEGWIKKILVQENESATINQPIAILTADEGESIEGFEVNTPAPQADKASGVEEKPKEDPSSKKEKQEVQKSQSFNQPVFVPEPPLEKYSFPFPLTQREGKIPASPLAKKIAKERNLDLSSIKGSGPRGRIMSEDLDLAQNASVANFAQQSVPKELAGSYEEVAMSPVQQVVASRLQASKTFIPHFYLDQKIEVSNMVQTRRELSSQNIKVSYNDFVVRATALALREHPKVNSGFNSANQTLIRFKTVDISIAVSLEEGLITPILRYADYKNLGQLSTEIKKLAKKAREGTLAMEEFKGGSFTISNLGMYGITSLKPVINPPQAAILGVGGMEEILRLDEGQVKKGLQMTLTLAADHRAVNGEDGAKFLKTLKELLENPALLLI
ncbi:MAG: Dihydrolipoyllysine-residue acetyltransferase component of pyruvate dehydrogenase complex [Chlamydiae bacterium]|nr:Dihydrolipoyllysine-residue acetyltransferase component of pyruvate dehydrogenase complex [Chlamydiota bacterium]